MNVAVYIYRLEPPNGQPVDAEFRRFPIILFLLLMRDGIVQRLPGGGRWRFLILDKTVERPVPPFSLSLSALSSFPLPPLLVEDGWTRVTTSPVRKDGIAKVERKQRDCLFDGLSETIQTRYLLPRPSLSFFDSLAAPWWSIWIPPRCILFRDLETCIQVDWRSFFFSLIKPFFRYYLIF